MVSASRLREALCAQGGRLADWQDSGFAGDMAYMRRSPDLFLNPENLLPGLKSVISFAVPYAAAGASDPDCPRGFGRIARYARGRDYHRVIKKLLKEAAKKIEQRAGRPVGWRAFSDAVPFLERAAAIAAGLGFSGKNTMVIRPGLGSYFFLAELLLDIEIEPDLTPAAQSGSCGSCSRCQISCPTGAFAGPGRLDARRCISYLTIEKSGGFSEDERRMVGDWVFGCDRCQEVCPFNHPGTQARVAPEFRPERGAGAFIELSRILAIKSDEDFTATFAGTPLMRAGRIGMIRNALAVCANQGCTELVPAIRLLIEGQAPEMVRIEAQAALSRLI